MAVISSTDRSPALTLTYSQKPGSGLAAKATKGGTTAASWVVKTEKNKPCNWLNLVLIANGNEDDILPEYMWECNQTVPP